MTLHAFNSDIIQTITSENEIQPVSYEKEKISQDSFTHVATEKIFLLHEILLKNSQLLVIIHDASTIRFFWVFLLLFFIGVAHPPLKRSQDPK